MSVVLNHRSPVLGIRRISADINVGASPPELMGIFFPDFGTVLAIFQSWPVVGGNGFLSNGENRPFSSCPCQHRQWRDKDLGDLLISWRPKSQPRRHLVADDVLPKQRVALASRLIVNHRLGVTEVGGQMYLGRSC